MSGKQASFSIVDDDEDDFELENDDSKRNISPILGNISSGPARKAAFNRMQQVSNEFESSDESNMNSPKKKYHNAQDSEEEIEIDNEDTKELLEPTTHDILLGTNKSFNKPQEINKEYESSDEGNISSPQKKFHKNQFPGAQMMDLPNPGPSNGRQTVTKIRAPQLIQISSDSDTEDSERDDHKKTKSNNIPGEYDPKLYEDLDVAEDIKELFQYIAKYVPQNLGQDYKFKPFIPDFLPAVGDIDAFLKVVPPDTNLSAEASSTIDQSDLGLVVLDEPAANQSDPAVLHLQLRASSVNVSHSAEMVVKKVENLEKNSKTVEKWIKDISDLHRTKSSPVLKYTNPMPDLDDLMEEWPENMENLLKIHGFPSYTMRGPLSRYIDINCCLFDIPIYKNKIQSLHLLFSLYAAVKTSHLYRAANVSRGVRTSISSNVNDNISNGTDQLLLD